MISIITATFNSEKTIGQTLTSVLNQTYQDWELLICDGGSTDNTLKIIDACGDTRIKIVSRTDHGIFDAYNKGLSNVSGEIFGTLNSDDHFSNDRILEFIRDQFQKHDNYDLIYGNVTYFKRGHKEKISRQWRNNFFKLDNFKLGFMPAHPTVYMRNKSCLRDVRYNPVYKYAGDFEYLIRIFKTPGLETQYYDKILVNMLDGGTADGNLKSKLKHWSELHSILKNHFGNGIGIPFIINKVLNRIIEMKK